MCEMDYALFRIIKIKKSWLFLVMSYFISSHSVRTENSQHMKHLVVLINQLLIILLLSVSAEERKGSLHDMASQRGVACRAQGWKVHLCAAQLLQLVSSAADSVVIHYVV